MPQPCRILSLPELRISSKEKRQPRKFFDNEIRAGFAASHPRSNTRFSYADAHSTRVTAYQKAQDGRWIPVGWGLQDHATNVIHVAPQARYEMPSAVWALVQTIVSRIPPAYSAPKPPLLSEFDGEEAKLEYAHTAWRQVFLRRTKRSSKSKLKVRPETAQMALRILERNKVAPIQWYWWGWDRPEFRFRSRGKIQTAPSWSTFLQPQRVLGMLDAYKQYPDDTWRRSTPELPCVQEFMTLRARVLASIYEKAPMSVEDAKNALHDVCSRADYDRCLSLATTEVQKLMSKELRDMKRGFWVWA